MQREIVRILDAFTDLTADLTAELTARKKQYEYYRDTLLDFRNVPSIIKSMLDMHGEVDYVKIKDKYIRLKGTPKTAKKMKEFLMIMEI